MKIIFSFLFMLFIFQTNLFAQEVWFGSSRAITRDYQRFIDFGDILGEFYLTPVLEDSFQEGDSVILKGFVHFNFERRSNIYISLIKKAKNRKFCEIICKQNVYELEKYIGISDSNGNFEIKTNINNTYLLFYDLERNEYRILFYEIKEEK